MEDAGEDGDKQGSDKKIKASSLEDDWFGGVLLIMYFVRLLIT